MRRVPLLLAAAFLAWACLPGAAAAQVRIGFLAPLTGPQAEAGIALRQGAMLAVEEINAAGGVTIGGKKEKLELLVEDTTSKPDVGVALGEKLITSDKVHILVGDSYASSVTMAVMELAPKYGIPIYSIEPVSGAIAEKVAANPQRYATYWKGDFNSDAYARTVFQTTMDLVKEGKFTPRTKTVAFVVEDTDYGRSNAGDAAKLFTEVGWKVVATETVPLGHTDFYPQFGKVRGLSPDVVVSCFTSNSSGIAFAKQYVEQGVSALHLAIYYPTRSEFIPQAGKAAEGILWTPLLFDPENIKAQVEFAKAIQEKFLKGTTSKPNSDNAYGYDGIMNIADVLTRAGSLDPKKISDAFATLDRRGLLGRYKFDPKNHTVIAGPDYIPVPTAQIQNGKNVIVWPATVKAGEYRTQPWIR
ncbi:MAG TPA: ABC transporter substrate-binding protein [Thermodesulfobacteriota bacterium]